MRYLEIWDSISLLNTSRSTYFDPACWISLLLRTENLAAPIFMDVSTLELPQLRRLALKTASLHKNFVSKRIICRSYSATTRIPKSDIILHVIAGTQLVLTYDKASSRSVTTIKCWDLTTWSEIGCVEYPKPITERQGPQGNLASSVFIPRREDHGTHLLGFVLGGRCQRYAIHHDAHSGESSQHIHF
jgi:hypothetical protein